MIKPLQLKIPLSGYQICERQRANKSWFLIRELHSFSNSPLRVILEMSFIEISQTSFWQANFCEKLRAVEKVLESAPNVTTSDDRGRSVRIPLARERRERERERERGEREREREREESGNACDYADQ